MSKFVIKKIIVFDTSSENIVKILKPGVYVFSDSRFNDFFLEGVTVSTVVGKNGCGKSSLMELLFRMINNLGAIMLKYYERPAAETLYWVEGVKADLYFELEGKDGTLCCDCDSVILTHDGHSFEWNKFNDRCIYKIKGIEQHATDFEVVKNAANHFFYMIATNYSMQAYIDADYRDEDICSWRIQQNNKNKNVGKYVWQREETGCWINSIFHKNDGYMCPIVLNPYRHEGTIDMRKETHLTTRRLCALLLQAQKEKLHIIEGYRLAFIEYRFNQRYLLDKFDKDMLREIPAERVSEKFLYIYLQDNSYAKAILDGYGIDTTKKMNYIELTLRLYLVYKTLNIASKYPQYAYFKPLGNVNNAFGKNDNPQELSIVNNLAEQIKKRHTHIELKVHQTIDLINKLNDFSGNDDFSIPLTYEKFCDLLGIDTQSGNVLERLNTLPPPLFEPTIYLIKNEEYHQIVSIWDDEREQKKRIAQKAIPISKLSSGERQFIYMTSTLLYHAFNILSIPREERIAYRNICMVLEEVEICFHPEYQRTFIKKLLSLFERTRLNHEMGINVIVVTHSPFVLSDIPKGNILYLDEGNNVTGEKHLNTFGANVNELLNQSFFLSGGFMGEFAKMKIESLVSYLKSDGPNNIWNEEKARDLIELVGDEVIQFQLRQLFAMKFKDSEYYRNWIEREARRLGIGV